MQKDDPRDVDYKPNTNQTEKMFCLKCDASFTGQYSHARLLCHLYEKHQEPLSVGSQKVLSSLYVL